MGTKAPSGAKSMELDMEEEMAGEPDNPMRLECQ